LRQVRAVATPQLPVQAVMQRCLPCELQMSVTPATTDLVKSSVMRQQTS